MKIRAENSGFTLVELALVLAIIGLLAGGVVGGQVLIQRSKISGVMNDIGKYRAAFNQFQVQYQALPGDYLDATEQWGTDAVTGGCAAPAPVAADRVPKKATCNGNGNNFIGNPTVSGEPYRLWQHLSNAGLIEGSFTGVTDAAGGFNPGENMPAGSIEGSGFMISTSGATSGHVLFFDQGVQTEMMFGKKASGSWPSNPVLTATEQKNIDSKMDDGRPGLGYVRSLKSGCATTTVNSTAEYNLGNKAVACTMQIFIKPVG